MVWQISVSIGPSKIFYNEVFFLAFGSWLAGYAHSPLALLIGGGIQSIVISISLVLAPSLIQVLFKDKMHKFSGISLNVVNSITLLVVIKNW